MKKFDIYCKEILSWKIAVKKVYESNLVLAFHHTKPSYRNHIVVVPKKCILDINHMDHENTELLIEVHKAIKISINEIWYTKYDSWIKVITNLWKYQDSPHFHYHVICWVKKIDW